MEDKIIKCPKCGRHYLPAEIFYPDDFLGHPTDIIKNDETGEIEYYAGRNMDLTEEYICDKCGTAFTVTASVDFKAVVNKKHDFSEDYSSPIYANRLILNEEVSKEE